MITIPTAFILGAGASVPYGLPLGERLWRDITDHDQYASILQGHAGYDRQTIVDFANRVRDAKPKSIDSYLDEQRRLNKDRVYDLGLLAIAALILKYECREPILMSAHDDDWYRLVLNAITHDDAESDTSRLWKAPVSFVIFNYDRSLETYLFRAATARGVPPVVADEGLQKLRIFHCYGQVGLVRSSSPHASPVPYGDVRYVQKAAAGIKIIGKNRREELPKGAIDAIEGAKRIVITGFGFDPFNADLLQLDRWIADPTKEVFITDMGLPLRESNYLDELQGQRTSNAHSLVHDQPQKRVFDEVVRFNGTTARLLTSGMVLA